MHYRFPLIALTLMFTAGLALAATKDGGKTLLNLDKNGIAIQGHDPVAYFTQDAAVKGSADHTATYEGATYHFVSAEHQKLFEANPDKYAPQFGGYCAYGVSINKLFKIDPEAFDIVNGRLILQYDKGVAKKFAKDTEGNLAKADGYWPGLVEKHGG